MPTTATLKPTVDSAQNLRVAPGVRIRTIRDGGHPLTVPPVKNFLAKLNVKAGHVYTVEFAVAP